MGRKKKSESEQLLRHPIRTRVDDRVFDKLSALLERSNCDSMGELTRKILSGNKITVLTKDMTLQPHIQELSRIRSEIHAIGVNINQLTKQAHSTDDGSKKVFAALKVAEEYAKVGELVVEVGKITEELGKRWLQRSA
jgi:hypothetical protein